MTRTLVLACIAIALVQHQANDNHVRKQGQQNAQSAKDVAGASTPSQSTPNGSNQKPSGDTEKKQHQTVDVVSVPKISTKKDATDWIMIGCTVVLTIVGIVGTCAAIKTLKAINRQALYMLVHAKHFDKLAKATANQADLMGRQLTQMEKQTGELKTATDIALIAAEATVDNVKAAIKAADAAKISADIAARVSVPTLRIEKFGFGYTGAASMAAILQFPNVEVVIKNYGQTPAFLRSWTIIFTCEELPKVPIYADYPGSGIVLEKEVVKPGEPYTLPKIDNFKRQ